MNQNDDRYNKTKQEIERQMKMGTRINPYMQYCSKSKPAPLSSRTGQILEYMRLGYSEVPEPEMKMNCIDEISKYMESRQMRYFGSWALDQWDYAADDMRRMGASEHDIQMCKDGFLSVLYHDFSTGKAFAYADDWYQSFPAGGYYNPYRFQMIYEDEFDIASKVTSYVKCRLAHPTVANLMNKPKPKDFDERLLLDGSGGIMVAYKSGSDVRDILVSKVNEIDNCVSEMIGEEEGIRHDQRIFVTDGVLSDKRNNLNTCVVYFHDFCTSEDNLLSSCVRAAISEAIPMDRWRTDSIMIDTNDMGVMRGQIDMCNMYLSQPNTGYQTNYHAGNIGYLASGKSYESLNETLSSDDRYDETDIEFY